VGKKNSERGVRGQPGERFRQKGGKVQTYFGDGGRGKALEKPGKALKVKRGDEIG